MLGARSAQCPNCGGPIEFGLGSSSALICPHCRYSVVRTDRDLQALGRVADLVPTSPPVVVGDSGVLAGRGFRVAGRLQLDHGRGPWDEWYLGFDDGSWGWLARAQGRWFLTQPADPRGLPPFEHLAPGQQGSFEGTGPTTWTVQEQGWSTLLSGEGELPFPIVPGHQGRYVDLAGPSGAFATVDYGDGTEPVKLFAGRELGHEELQLAQTARGPRPEERVQMGKLTCPTCGAPVEIHAPESTERAACAYCYSLLDVSQGHLELLEQLQQPQIQPAIPLGTDGTLKGEKLKCIGFMERYTVVQGVTYAWREYLLYGEHGYRWLMEDNGHWIFLKSISPGDITSAGGNVRYDGKSYRRFASNQATVRFVIGEFYWKVQVGESTTATDFVAPPRVLSEERGDNEIVWSAGEYVPPKEIWKAFGLPGSAPKARGVGTAQPNPHKLLVPAASFAVLMAVFLGILVTLDWGRSSRVLVEGPVQLPPTQSTQTAGAQPAQDNASYTPPFTVTDGPTTLEVELDTSADNDFVGVGCALINEDSGEIREFYVSAEYYHGVTGGESWSDGSRDGTVYVDRVEEGRYVMRLDPEWNHWSGPFVFGRGSTVASPPRATIKVTQGSRSPWCCCITFVLLLFPLPIILFRRAAFEKKRWENSNLW